MRFPRMTLMLGKGYSIKVIPREHDAEVFVYYAETKVGCANFVTDGVDVGCVTSIELFGSCAHDKISSQHTLAEAFVKFLIKFPSAVRKLEFRFFIDPPKEIKPALEKYKFKHEPDLKKPSGIFVRTEQKLPELDELSPYITFSKSINAKQLEQLHALLKRDAYWQINLSLERLKLLLQSSECFFSFANDIPVGFTRVLTDHTSFASIWDVVVDSNYRKQHIATALMLQAFNDAGLKKIPTWLLYTDSDNAIAMYRKFGFSEGDVPHKFKMQDTQPEYTDALIKAVDRGLPMALNANQSLSFLFGSRGKRALLSQFWKEAISETREAAQNLALEFEYKP